MSRRTKPKRTERKYYRLDNIMKKAPNSLYYMCYGERSNGKSYACLEYMLKDYLKTGRECAIIRRWKEDFRGKRAPQMWANLVYNELGENKVKEYTNGKFDNIIYQSGRWYLSYYDKEHDKNITAPEPFCYSFGLSDYEHDKSSSFGKVGNVLFDEFIPKPGGLYLQEEFVTFMQTISTIIRGRDGIKIFMCANSNDRYALYFKEFGLKHVKDQKRGTIDVYTFGDSGLQVAVEYCDSPSEGKPSDKYFAFDNPSLKVITTGEWCVSLYPLLLRKFSDKDVKFRYFIKYEDEILQANIVVRPNEAFTFIHRKTTPIKDDDKDIIFSCDQEQKVNYLTKLTRPTTKTGSKIASFFANNKVFYSSNEVGDIMNHYLNWCKTS